MNYARHYFKLIERAILRDPHPSATLEKHHIRPKSLSGSDDASNIVLLTLKEHRLAHLLLFAMGFQNQIFSVAAICDDKINKNRPHRYLQTELKVTRYIRRNLAKTKHLNARIRNRESTWQNPNL